MRKIFTAAAVLAAGIAFGMILAHGTINAESANADPEVLSRLNDIAKSQQDIIASLNSMKEELQIIKIRVTQNQ